MPARPRFRPGRLLEGSRHVWHTLRSERVLQVGAYFLGILFSSGAVMYYLERRHNAAFRSLADGFWWALVTLTTIGYGDRYPITGVGRLMAGVVIILGMGVVGITTAKIASVLVERRIKEGRGLSEAQDLSGHFVIMGWKPDMHLLVREILAAHPGLESERLVLVNSAGQEANDGLRREFAGLRYLHGELTDPLVLQRANIARAAKVFVLADASGGRSDQEVDARTVMALMNIENLAPEVYSYAEALDRQYVDYLRLAHCDEIILTREYGRFMLVTASASEGISQALLKLMDVSAGGGLTSVAIPEQYVGRTFAELAAGLKATDAGMVVGLLENTGQPLVIKRNALREAQKTANVGVLVENLRRVRELTANRPVLNPPEGYRVAPHARALVIRRTVVATETAQ